MRESENPARFTAWNCDKNKNMHVCFDTHALIDFPRRSFLVKSEGNKWSAVDIGLPLTDLSHARFILNPSDFGDRFLRCQSGLMLDKKREVCDA